MSVELRNNLLRKAVPLTGAVLALAMAAENSQAQAINPATSGGAAIELASGGAGYSEAAVTSEQLEKRDINKLVKFIYNPPKDLSNGRMIITSSGNQNTNYTVFSEKAPNADSPTKGTYFFHILKQNGQVIKLQVGDESAPLGKVPENVDIFTAEAGDSTGGLLEQQVITPHQSTVSEFTLEPFAGLPIANSETIKNFFGGMKQLVIDAMAHLYSHRVVGPKPISESQLVTEPLPDAATAVPFIARQ